MIFWVSLVSKGMTNIVCKANNESMVLARVRGKAGFNSPEVNRCIPDEAEKHFDVNGGASEDLKGTTVVHGWVGQVIST
jgi:hypothetical protein